MPNLSVKSSENIFTLTIEALSNAFDNSRSRIDTYVKLQMAAGRTREEILQTLQDDFAGNKVIFKDLSGDIEGIFDEGLNTIFHVNSVDALDNKIGYFIRILEPSAEHCDSCIYESEQPPREIGVIPLPGYQSSHGTNCNIYCMCSIEPVE